MARVGHSSTRAALIYLHSTDERHREIAVALGALAVDELKLKTSRARSSRADRARKPADRTSSRVSAGIMASRWDYVQDFAEYQDDWVGIRLIQSTRRQTLAYALTDSPAGQLAWITEKFGEWIDGDVPDDGVDRDQLLTNVSVYWFTSTAGSSARLYFEAQRSRGGSPASSTVPTGMAVLPYEIAPAIRRFAELSNAIVHWPNSTVAVNSQPWKNWTCWSGIYASSFGCSADHRRVAGARSGLILRLQETRASLHDEPHDTDRLSHARSTGPDTG